MATVDFARLVVPLPLREDTPGVFRVGESRVLLELVIRAVQRGETPESIVQSYDTLSLSDVYAVISYYLANPAPFEEHLHIRDEAADATRSRIEGAQSPQAGLRETVLARAKAKGLLRGQAGD